MRNKWSEMYQRGYDDMTICFSYIPEFVNEKEKQDYERGLKDGLKAHSHTDIKQEKNT